MKSSLTNIFLGIITAFILGYILVLGKSLFVSLIFTFFIFILLSSLSRFLQKYTKNIWITRIISIILPILFLWLIVVIISTQLDAFLQELPRYKAIFTEMSSYIQTRFWLQFDITSLASKINFSAVFWGISWGVSSLLGYIGTIVFFLIFLFLEKKYFIHKIEKILEDSHEKKFFSIVQKIHSDLTLYFGVKFCMALLNASVSYIVMFFFGMDYALFFALVVFLLDFIPNIGGPIALSLPFFYSFLQLSSPLSSFFLLAALLIPQTITGNFLEPKLIGSRLNISGFIILLSLLFWGSIWGVVGAFLAVPLMTSINIVLSKFKTTQSLAILLSEKGDIQSDI